MEMKGVLDCIPRIQQEKQGRNSLESATIQYNEFLEKN